MTVMLKRPREYEVGYGKPPVHSRFKSGRSGNPRGRPRGSRNRLPGLAAERLKTILLQEAYRTVPVNDPSGRLRMPMAQAVVRSIALNAAKGNPRAQRHFTDLVGSTERADRQLYDQWLSSAIEYKVGWERELEERERLGAVGPTPLPHPDHIVIDRRAGTIRITGPMTKEEKAKWDKLRQRKRDCDLEIADFEQELRKDPDPNFRKFLLDEIERERKIKRMISKLIPD